PTRPPGAHAASSRDPDPPRGPPRPDAVPPGAPHRDRATRPAQGTASDRRRDLPAHPARRDDGAGQRTPRGRGAGGDGGVGLGASADGDAPGVARRSRFWSRLMTPVVFPDYHAGTSGTHFVTWSAPLAPSSTNHAAPSSR